MEVVIFFLILIIIVILILILSTKNSNILFEQKIIIKPIPYTFYWINLDKSKDRYNNMLNLFNKYNIKNQRIPAILDKEKGCTLSHIKAIKTFYNSNEEIGIICEDDLSMDYRKYWRKNLEDVVICAPKDWEIIQLALIINPFSLISIKKMKNLYTRYVDGYASSLCYVINRTGAFNIINNIKPYCHTENSLFLTVKTYTYKFPMFTYPDINNSLIHPGHLYFHKLSKNWVTNYLKYN